MNFRRYSASLPILIAAWFVMIAVSACRHTPSGPNDPPHNTDTVRHTDSCCGGAIVLNVHDSATGAHLVHGKFVLSGNGIHDTTEINSDGKAIFSHLCPGTYEVAGTADGYNRHAEHYTLACNDEQHHDFNLSPVHQQTDCCHGVVTLILRDSATGEAITGGTVTLWKGSTNLGSETINPNGNAWDGLCQGDGYSFSVSKDGYNHYEWNIEALGCNEHRTTDRRIAAIHHDAPCDNASMTLTVVDSVHRDTRLGGVHVTIRIDGHNDNYATGVTDDHGQVTFNHLLGHTTYIITFSKDGYNEKHFTWQAGDCTDYTETIGLGHQ